jgi:hypothetical protein
VSTAEPVVYGGEAVQSQSGRTALTLARSTDEAGVLEHFEVLGDGGLGECRLTREFENASLAFGETHENCSTSGVGEGGEGTR